MEGLLPFSKYHQLSPPASKSKATSEEEKRKESSEGANSTSLEDSGADKALVYQSKDLVHHQGKVLVHHPFKGSVLVRFPDPPQPSGSETRSVHQQRRKDQQGQELALYHNKTPSYNEFDDKQSDPKYLVLVKKGIKHVKDGFSTVHQRTGALCGLDLRVR